MGKKYLSPLQSLDFYLDNYHKICKKLRLQNELQELQSVLHRNVDQTVRDLLEHTFYQTLVVTDLKKTIVWASDGFFEMTGYTKQYAIGKRPVFLQGKNTAKEDILDIRRLVKEEKAFTKTLINYRKNGEEYYCHIQVLPLLDHTKKVTHFLAMERELLVA